MGLSHRYRLGAVSAILLLLATGLVDADDCTQDKFRISSQSDADALADCSTLTGDVVIAASAEGSIHLRGVRRIDGSLSNGRCVDADGNGDALESLLNGNFAAWRDCWHLTSLVADDLQMLSGTLALGGLVNVTEISFQSLETVTGGVSIEYVPKLTTLDLAELQSAGSIRIRHGQQLAELILPGFEFITGEGASSFVEIEDLAINKWPFLKIRQTSREDGPRRLGRLLARDLPNIQLFEFNNADAIGTLEAHGFPHQRASLARDTSDPEFEHSTDRRFDQPVRAVDNLTVAGFGQNFSISSNDYTVDITTLTITNTTMERAELSSVTNLESLFVTNNTGLVLFTMPANMESLAWDTIEFSRNPRLRFSMDDTLRVSSWDWGFGASSLIIESSPIDISFIRGSDPNITALLRIDSTENIQEICAELSDRVSAGVLQVPANGYWCGGVQRASVDNSAAGMGWRLDTVAALMSITLGALVFYGVTS